VDRGKTRVVLPGKIKALLKDAVTGVTKPWKAFKRQADRDDRVHQRDQEHWLKAQQAKKLSVKEAVYQVMERAYLKASANGTLPANARQIMYAARPLVLALTGGQCWKQSSYFTQKLLPDFIKAYPGQTAQWDVVFDARGSFHEPHTRAQIGLGTLGVREYISEWTADVPESFATLQLPHACQTSGPCNRYRYVLFIEKEGFDPLLQQARMKERFDLALMSTKGMSVIAARQLIEDLTKQGVTIFVLHDFDKSGFSILHTLRSNTRRYQYAVAPMIIDLGLRLADVRHMDLQSEVVEFDGNVDPRLNLRESGATEEECDFLVTPQRGHKWSGQRVELNAMDSQQFITWLEGKLIAAGVQKLVPDQMMLGKAYRQAWRSARVQRVVNEALRATKDEAHAVLPPPQLEEHIRKMITGTARSWDEAVHELAAREELLSRAV
jgi:hypothetical protein